MSGGAVVDLHTHVVPGELVELARRRPLGVTVRESAGGDPVIVLESGLEHPVSAVFSDVDAKLAQMDGDGIDVAIVSTSPSLILPIERPAAAREACASANDAAASFAAKGGGRLHAMACVPLVDPPAAVEELRRAAHELGMVGVLIGTSVGTRMLSDPAFEPFFVAAAQERVPVLVHPYLSMAGRPPPGLDGFHLANAVGNPHETFLAAAHLIEAGVLDRHPQLLVVLVHGGGSLPYQLGRLAHARRGAGNGSGGSPRSLLDGFLFDTVVFDSRAFEFLESLVGAERVVFGSDRPFGMADVSGIEHARRLAPDEAQSILSGNAERAYRIAVDRVAQTR